MVRRRFALVALAFAVALFASKAAAQGGQTPPGAIYFTWAGFTHSMNGAGGNKTPLPQSVSGEPSRLLHGGQRWFLQFAPVSGTYPDGGQRRELFAVRADGLAAAQLTDQADLEPAPMAGPRWNFADSKVSWIAARWVGGVLVAAGIYASDVLYDGAGDVAELAAQPANPLVPGTVVDLNDGYGPRPEMTGHDGSPDGVKIVYAVNQGPAATRQLFIADTGQPGSPSQLLPTTRPAGDPSWSPAGTNIVFRAAEFQGSIYTINPNGTQEKEILRSHSGMMNYVASPRWSANGQHVIYQKGGSILGGDRHDLYRAKADASSRTNLTAEIDTRYPNLGGGPATPVGWR